MKRLALSEGIRTGLYYMHKYRFLTISQFARITNFHADHAAKVLRDFERWRLVGYLGFTAIPGHGKTPKVYFMEQKSWELLCAECDVVGEFSEVSMEVNTTDVSPAENH